MRVLAVDTTIPGGSLAIGRDGVVLDAVAGDPRRTHAERLLEDIERLLLVHGLTVADVDVFGLAVGPGSFTGLRIGIASVQGLAYANRRPVACVSALEALALGAAPAAHADVPAHPGRLTVWMDAHRGEVFWALYDIGQWLAIDRDGVPAAGLPAPLAGPSVDRPADLIDRWVAGPNDAPTVFAGGGAVVWRDAVAGRLGSARIVEDVPLGAASVARLAMWAAARGDTVAAHDVRPLYIRRPDAVLARERARGGTPA